MSGRLLYVVGPSGAGKDSVLNYVRAGLPVSVPAAFARRTITRPAAAGGEDHIAVTVDGFAVLREAGAFAMHWTANGLHYGIGREIRDWLAAGLSVVVSGSRGHVDAARRDFPQLEIVHITAPPEVLRARLATRGRETPDAIKQRLARGSLPLPDGLPVVEIRNDGAIARAGETFIALLACGGSIVASER